MNTLENDCVQNTASMTDANETLYNGLLRTRNQRLVVIVMTSVRDGRPDQFEYTPGQFYLQQDE